MKERKKRLIDLEIIRAFSFMLIIVQHTIGGYSLDPKAPLNNAVILRFIFTIAKPAVPIFIFISAVSLFYTYKDGINIKEFYKKRLFTIILPYIICCFIYIILFHKKVDNLFVGLINGNISYHLWYIGTIIQIYLTFPIALFLLKKLAKASRKFNLIFISIFSVISFLLIHNKPLVNIFVGTIFTHEYNPSIREFMSVSPIYWYIYFIIGFYFISSYDKFLVFILKYKNVLLIVFTIFLIPSYLMLMEERINFYLNDYLKTGIIICFNTLSIFFWYYVSMSIAKLKNKLVDVLKFISHYSFSGYLYHVLIINYIAKFLYANYVLTNNYIFPSVFIYISTIVIASIVCHLLSYIPYSKYIFGITRFKKK